MTDKERAEFQLEIMTEARINLLEYLIEKLNSKKAFQGRVGRLAASFLVAELMREKSSWNYYLTRKKEKNNG